MNERTLSNRMYVELTMAVGNVHSERMHRNLKADDLLLALQRSTNDLDERDGMVREILEDAWDVISSSLYDEMGAVKQEIVRRWLAETGDGL